MTFIPNPRRIIWCVPNSLKIRGSPDLSNRYLPISQTVCAKYNIIPSTSGFSRAIIWTLTHWSLEDLNGALYNDRWLIYLFFNYPQVIVTALDPTVDKSTWVQVMASCRHVASHYWNQYWHSSVSPNGFQIFGCTIYKTAYSFKQSLPPMPKTMILYKATTRLFTPIYLHRYGSCCACVCLRRQGRSLRGSSLYIWSSFENCILLHKTWGYMSVKLKTTFSVWMIYQYHSYFRRVFPFIVFRL